MSTFKTSLFLTLLTGLIFLFISCNMLPEEPAAEEDDTPVTASSIVNDIGTLELNIPASLQESSSSQSQGASRASVDYNSLNEVSSQAYERLVRDINDKAGEVETLNDIFAMFKNNIDNGLAENTVFSDIFIETDESGDSYSMNVKGIYSFDTDADGNKYILLKAAALDPQGNIHGAVYIEARDLGNDNVMGQAMFTGGGDESGSHYSKIVFNTATDEQANYFRGDFTDPTTSQSESFYGAIIITPDTSDNNNGVYVKTRFESPQWGTHMDLGWANDSFGGVQSYGEWSYDDNGTTVTHEDINSEYFVMENSEAKITYREWGTKDPSHMYWNISEARSNIANLDAINALNAYNAATGDAPEFITLSSTHAYSADPNTFTVNIYTGNLSVSDLAGATPIDTKTNYDPYKLWNIYWLEGAGSTVTSGDAVYKFSTHEYTDNGDNTGTEVAVFERVAVVPASVTRFGKTGFYQQSLYPLKYVTGTATSGATLIQTTTTDWDNDTVADDWDNDGNPDLLYFIDINGNGSYDQFGDDGVTTPEKELMVWAFEEYEWDEETQQEIISAGTPWLFGKVPNYTDADGNSIAYTYATEKTAINAKLNGVSADDYIGSVTVPAFVVAGTEWVTVSATDFE